MSGSEHDDDAASFSSSADEDAGGGYWNDSDFSSGPKKKKTSSKKKKVAKTSRSGRPLRGARRDVAPSSPQAPSDASDASEEAPPPAPAAPPADTGPARRVSSRSTKFRANMSEQNPLTHYFGRASTPASPTGRKRRSPREPRGRGSDAASSADSDDEGEGESAASVPSKKKKTLSAADRKADKKVRSAPAAKRAGHQSLRKQKKGAKGEEKKAKKPPPPPKKKPQAPTRVSSRSSKTSVYLDGTDDEDDFLASDADQFSAASADSTDKLKIRFIVASRHERASRWTEILRGMNTTEVENGSMWFQESAAEGGPDAFEERYLVKWDGLSYLHCSWETEADIVAQVENGGAYLRTFFKKADGGLLFSADERGDGDYFDPSFCQIERVLDVDKDEEPLVTDKDAEGYSEGRGRQFLVKWMNVAYSLSTFEYERDLELRKVEYTNHLEEYVRRIKKPTIKAMKESQKKGEKSLRHLYKVFGEKGGGDDAKIAKFQKELAANVFRNGGSIRDYQAEGVSWLLANHVNDRGSILADEMGLGKTVQTVVYVDTVRVTLGRRGPYLVVAPLSTIAHWHREFTGWTECNAIVYHGTAEDRETIRSAEFPYAGDRPGGTKDYLRRCHRGRHALEKTWQVDVVITTPELCVAEDSMELAAVDWEVLVVDEAHRLKNHHSKLSQQLRSAFRFGHVLLLTGTPIQNNMTEMWALLNLVDEEAFPSSHEFIAKYGQMTGEGSVEELHQAIRPYILRRLKEDVETSVPPKVETLIEVELTGIQKKYYRALFERNVQFLNKGKKNGLNTPSLNNLAMQLRKCCNHPFLLKGIEEDVRQKEQDKGEAEFIVDASGKLILLDKLLPKLAQNGHRVLLFSQFKIMLDILEDYLRLRSTTYERIDGSITGAQRQAAIDRFQRPADAPGGGGRPPPFIMLLSTRAGGVGINLTAADTCIIFDSDWNPQNDLQAMARCHRIGQKKKVKVYRLITKKTYEFHMFHKASLKMGLDQAVLHGITETSDGQKNQAMSKEELENLLRHGAYDMLNEAKNGEADKASNEFINKDIDEILGGAQTIVHDNTGSNSSAARGTFSKASFKVSSKNAQGEEDKEVDIDDPDFWKKMVGEGTLEEKKNVVGKRKRTVRSYQEMGDIADDAESDFSTAGHESDGSSDEGMSPNEKEPGWNTTDIKGLMNLLQTFGYGKVFENKLGFMAKDKDEIRHRGWALAFSVLVELTDNITRAAKERIAERTAAKAKADIESSLVVDAEARVEPEVMEEAPTDSEDPVAVAVPMAVVVAVAPAAPPDPDHDSELRKLWREHVHLVPTAYTDAEAYRAKHPPRTPTVDGSTPAEAAFFDSLWPVLKTRGWTNNGTRKKMELVPSAVVQKRAGSKTTYRSVQKVLPDIVLFHPELKSVVESINAIYEDSLKVSLKAFNEQGTRLNYQDMSYSAMVSFLEEYAPSDILSFRRSSFFKINSKTFLEKLKYISILNTVVSQSRAKKANLASYVPSCDVFIPGCSEWGARHDALLLDAAERNGWIENDASYKLIKKDKQITWDSPGEARRVCHDAAGIRETSRRVLTFLTTCTGLSEFKGCDFHQLATRFGLVKSEGDKSTWTFDEALLQRALAAQPDFVSSFPEKRYLVKRLKSLLSKLSVGASAGAVLRCADRSEDGGFSRLDTGDSSVMFLHFLLHTAAQKNNSDRNKVMLLALNEIRVLRSTFPAQRNLMKIDEHLTYISLCKKSTPNKHLKNVLRVLLGLLPMVPVDNKDERLFPEENQLLTLTHHLEHSRKQQRTATRKENRLLALGNYGLTKATLLDRHHATPRDACVLSPCEISLVHVLCSHGLPVWNESNRADVDGSAGVVSCDEEEGRAEHAFDWDALVDHYERRLEEDLQKAQRDLGLRQFGTLVDAGHQKARERVAFFEEVAAGIRRVAASKSKVLRTAFVLTVLNIVEKLKQKMGAVDNFSKAGAVKKMNRSDHCLGPKVMQFFSKELTKWNQSLAIDSNHTMTNNTSGQKHMLDSLMCRQCIIQIAQQTRLRSLILKSSDSYFTDMMRKAVKNSRNNDDKWPQQPDWWVTGKNLPIQDDCDLIHGISKHGYSGFRHLMDAPESGLGEKEKQAPEGTQKLSASAAQLRVNQLTRELSAIDDTSEMMRLISKKAARRISSTPQPARRGDTPGSGSSGHDGTPSTAPGPKKGAGATKKGAGSNKKGAGIQSSIGFFFASKPGGKGTPPHPQAKDVISVDSDGDGGASFAASPGKRHPAEESCAERPPWTTPTQKKVKTAV
eukprot:CAMPEP_0194266774 /NCGR_PEP_ID=MMETSP0169-20130528/1566_1 /TAXON_ID=218684 /ORGANISM="Corethron pennatum, Strain L29A3" /LENGTH=2264 /DNA_ID=CAMNT_0039007537 /DNA_START=251 /DNA_END=7045 /DNA_ORIENTATION=+